MLSAMGSRRWRSPSPGRSHMLDPEWSNRIWGIGPFIMPLILVVLPAKRKLAAEDLRALLSGKDEESLVDLGVPSEPGTKIIRTEIKDRLLSTTSSVYEKVERGSQVFASQLCMVVGLVSALGKAQHKGQSELAAACAALVLVSLLFLGYLYRSATLCPKWHWPVVLFTVGETFACGLVEWRTA